MNRTAGCASASRWSCVSTCAASVAFAAQEFPPRRQVEKQRTRLDARARRVAAVADLLDPAAVDEDFRARERAGLARRQPETRHAGDARQRLAAKAQRGDGGEVRARADFAGGVAFEAEQRVVAVHAVPVVRHPHERDPAALDDDLHGRRLGVEAVFHQFLDHRGGPFHHLARRHLAGDDLGQQGDSAHGETGSTRSADRSRTTDLVLTSTGGANINLAVRIPFRNSAMMTITDNAVKHLRALLAEQRRSRRRRGPAHLHRQRRLLGPPVRHEFRRAQGRRRDRRARRRARAHRRRRASASCAARTIDYCDDLTGTGFRIQNPERPAHLRLRHVVRAGHGRAPLPPLTSHDAPEIPDIWEPPRVMPTGSDPHRRSAMNRSDVNGGFPAPPVEYDAPQPKGHLFLWTVFLLLLVGFSMACWIGSYLVFSRPEIPLSYKILRKIKKIDLPQRFKVQDPPKGEFLGPEKIYNRFNTLKSPELAPAQRRTGTQLPAQLPGQRRQGQVPYVTGPVHDPGFVRTRAGRFRAVGRRHARGLQRFPKLLIEHMYCAPAHVAPAHQAQPPDRHGHRAAPDLRTDRRAACHQARRRPLLLTVVPLNYGSYVFKGADGGFSLEPPTELNVAAGWPVIRGDRYRAGERRLRQSPHEIRLRSDGRLPRRRQETGHGPARGRSDARSPRRRATPAPSRASRAELPRTGQGDARPARSPAASPTPPRSWRSNSTPTPAWPHADGRAGRQGRGRQRRLAPALPPGAVGDADARAGRADADPGRRRQLEEVAHLRARPATRRPHVRMGEIAAFNERGGLNGDTVYLSGQFTVRAVGENKARGIKNAVLRSTAEENVRVIVEYPTDRPLPAQGTEISRDEQRPFPDHAHPDDAGRHAERLRARDHGLRPPL